VDCNCLLENGLCGTCRSQNRRINSGETNNYCEQTLENLQNIIQELKTKEQSKLVEYQVTIVNSQIRMFHKSPCKFKLFIDNIIL
jgi:hypothetical protein